MVPERALRAFVNGQPIANLDQIENPERLTKIGDGLQAVLKTGCD